MAVLRGNFDAISGVKETQECKRALSDGIIWDDSVFRNPFDFLEKCKERYGQEAIDRVFAASVLSRRYTADIPTRPSESLIEWAEKIPMLDGIYLDEQYLRFSLVAPWGADAVKVYSVIRRYVYELRKDC